MSLRVAKCSQCGANININDNNKTGFCSNCGAKFFNEDVVINNITNNIFNETIDGKSINRQIVLEKILIEFYNGKSELEDNLKEYSFKVLEIDSNNILANFVAFNNINNFGNIAKLLRNKNLKISTELYSAILNLLTNSNNATNYFDEKIIEQMMESPLSDDKKLLTCLSIYGLINKNELESFFQKIKTHNLSTKNTSMIKEYLDNINSFNNPRGFIYLIYSLNFSEFQNNEIIEYLLNKKSINKIRFLSELNYFANKHPDFYFDSQKFKEKLLRLNQKYQELKERKNQIIENELKVDNFKFEKEKNKRKLKKQELRKNFSMLFFFIFLIFSFLLIFIFNK